MRHYVLLLQPTTIGLPGFLSESFVRLHESLNIVPEIDRMYHRELATIEEAREALAKSQFQPIRDIMTKVQGLNSWSIEEFAVNGCGALTTLWYNEGGELVNVNHWFIDRTVKATYPVKGSRHNAAT